MLPKRAVKSLLRRLNPTKELQRNYEVQLFSATSKKRLQEELLDASPALFNLVQRDEVEKLITLFYEAPQQDKRCYSLSLLLSFSNWLKLYG